MAGAFTLFSAGAVRAMAQEVFPRPSDGGYQPDAATMLLFKFDEAAGEVARDASAHGNDGAIRGASWTEGRYAWGLRFDGINDRVRVEDAPSLRLSNALTLEAWVKPDRRRGGGTVVAKLGSYALLVKRPMPLLRAGGVIQLGSRRYSILSNAALAPGIWQHIAFIFDGIRMAILINGTVDKVKTAEPRPVNQSVSPLFVGVAGEPGVNWFRGVMDEVRLSSVARDPADLDPNGG
jgi:hypothetical protein